jgi:hypothetical protein
MPEEDRFRLPGSSYEQLGRIIKAYNLMRGPAGPADVARPLGIDSTIVSRNNGFLLGTGLVEGGNKKMLTDRGQALGRALEYEIDDDIRRGWREVVATTDFLREIVDAVRIRGGMLPPALQAHVAYSARQPSTSTTRTGAATVVDILRLAGAIEERDGKLVAAAPVISESVPHDDFQTAPAAEAESDAEEPTVWAGPSLRVATAPISVTVNVSVECSIDDLPRLGEKLAELHARLEDLTLGDS